MQEQENYLLIETPSLKNRALNYGDGCFTTMMSIDGRVELLDLHVNRLLADMKKLFIFNSQKPISFESLKQLINKTARDAFAQSCSQYQIIKLLVARGDSERGYAPSKDSLPVIIPSVTDYDIVKNRPGLEQGVKVAVAELTLSNQTLLTGIKHLNRLEQVLAKIELANRNDADDLLLTLPNGDMVELSASNFFYNINGVWYTPSLKNAGVNGVMREFILAFLQASNIVCEVRDRSVVELASIDAAFSCNAVTKVLPIASIKHLEQIYALNTKLSFDVGANVADAITSLMQYKG